MVTSSGLTSEEIAHLLVEKLEIKEMCEIALEKQGSRMLEMEGRQESLARREMLVHQRYLGTRNQIDLSDQTGRKNPPGHKTADPNGRQKAMRESLAGHLTEIDRQDLIRLLDGMSMDRHKNEITGLKRILGLEDPVVVMRIEALGTHTAQPTQPRVHQPRLLHKSRQ